ALSDLLSLLFYMFYNIYTYIFVEPMFRRNTVGMV
ncbi:MAG: hypothetical protein ACI90V_010191, partial [Bacillariaceae sp.]